MVYVDADVQVIEDYDEPIFYSSNWYWRYDGGVWYQSRYHTRGWVRVSTPPPQIARIDRPAMYVHYKGKGQANAAQRHEVNEQRQEDKREMQQEKREEKREEQQERREEKREVMQEKREDKAEKREDKAERKEDKAERKEDKAERKEDKAERKEDKKDDKHKGKK